MCLKQTNTVEENISKKMDADMMETEASSSGQNPDIRELLTLARQLINQGKSSQALQAVVAWHIYLPTLLS